MLMFASNLNITIVVICYAASFVRIAMSKRKRLLFQVGERAEMRSFIPGFRSAWFRCELKEVAWSKGQIKYRVQYYDYDDGLEWAKLYEVHRKGTKKAKKELMFRPQFPSIYHESELPDLNAISDVVVVVDGGWSVGDMVDWRKDGCFWSGTITKVLGDGTVEIKLPDEPVGEGLTYTVSCKELRPSLNWSPNAGWEFPAPKESQNGHSHARLIQPVKQAPLSKSLADLVEDNQNAKATPRSSSDFNDSMSSHTSTSSLPLLSRIIHSKGSPKLNKGIFGKDLKQTPGECMDLDARGSSIRKPSCSDSVSSTYVGDTSTEAPVASSVEKKGSETVSAKRKRLIDAIPLNSTSCDSIESAIMDLEELVCRVKWLKRILKPESPSTSLDKKWEFLEYPVVSKPK